MNFKRYVLGQILYTVTHIKVLVTQSGLHGMLYPRKAIALILQ